MKVNITKIRAHVEVHIELSGSVLAGTIRAAIPKVQTSYEIESPDDPDRVAKVLRNARAGCYVRAALSNPVEFEDSTTLNGEPFDFD